jgi:hypothetical protein
MHMIGMRRAFAGITAGIALLMAINPPAEAAPRTASTPAVADVCATGFRGQPAYDQHCLTTGTWHDARREWHTGYTTKERRAQCTQARRLGMVTVVRETRGDVISDTYRNDRAMTRATALVGSLECARLSR